MALFRTRAAKLCALLLLCCLPARVSAADTIPPVTVLSFETAPYLVDASTYISGSNRVVLTATDTGSPPSEVKRTNYFIAPFGAPLPPNAQVSTYIPNNPFMLFEGSHTVYYTSVDNANNRELPPKFTNIFVDTTSPITQLEIDPLPQQIAGIFYASPGAVVSLSTSDPVSHDVASGVKYAARYIDVPPDSCVYDGPQVSSEPFGSCKHYEYSGPFSLPLGPHAIYFKAKDNVGNNELMHVASITVQASALWGGTISISPALPAGSTVTVAVSTDYFRNDTGQYFSFDAGGISLPYNLSLPGPATYYLAAFAWLPGQDHPPGAPIVSAQK